MNPPTTKQDNKKIDKPKYEHQCHSPRRLIKQVALESPPNNLDMDDNFFRTIKPENQSK